MDDEIEAMVVKVRADTSGFARDVAEMRATLEGPLVDGAERAGRLIESALTRAIVTGKFGFDDLKKIALSAMAEIAAAAVRSGLGAAGGGGASGGLGSLLSGLIGPLLGLPGRATGGGVAPGRAYMVGERGPEVFVPTASGRIETGIPAVPRDVRVTIHVNAPAGSGSPEALTRSSRQIARAVRSAVLAQD